MLIDIILNPRPLKLDGVLLEDAVELKRILSKYGIKVLYKEREEKPEVCVSEKPKYQCIRCTKRELPLCKDNDMNRMRFCGFFEPRTEATG